MKDTDQRRMDLRREPSPGTTTSALVGVVAAAEVGGAAERVGVWGALFWLQVMRWVGCVGKYGWLVLPALVAVAVYLLSERKKRIRERARRLEKMFVAVMEHLEHMEGRGKMHGPLWTRLEEEAQKVKHFCRKKEWRYLGEVVKGSRDYQGKDVDVQEGKEWAKKKRRRGKRVFRWLVRV